MAATSPVRQTSPTTVASRSAHDNADQNSVTYHTGSVGVRIPSALHSIFRFQHAQFAAERYRHPKPSQLPSAADVIRFLSANGFPTVACGAVSSVPRLSNSAALMVIIYAWLASAHPPDLPWIVSCATSGDTQLAAALLYAVIVAKDGANIPRWRDAVPSAYTTTRLSDDALGAINRLPTPNFDTAAETARSMLQERAQIIVDDLRKQEQRS